MDYLADPFNQSINPPFNYSINTVFNILSVNLFYYIVASFVYKLNEIQEQEMHLEGECDSNIISQNIPDIVYDNVFDDMNVDNKVKQDLVSLLNINSLERHYILYYIFKLRGAFYNGSVNINTYAYYKTVLNDWRNIYFIDETHSSPINLDSNLNSNSKNNYQIIIENLICDCNIAHIRFLSWLFYSGIYNYLMENLEIKKIVLNDMNERKILTGNLFLKYQLLLLDMEELENLENLEKRESVKTNDNTEYPIKKIETIEVESDIDDGDDGDDGDGDGDGDDGDDGDDVDNKNFDHCDDNENELKNRPITDNFADMNEMTFAYKLLSSVRNIAIRSIVSTWKIVKEEIDELFHPVLG